MREPRGTRHESFPYGNADATVTRLAHGWRITVGTRTADGLTLVDAFETLLGGKHIGLAEMGVVVAALDWNDAFAD